MNYKMKLTIWYIQRFFFNWLAFFYMFIPAINLTYDKVDFVYDYFLLITLFYIIMVIRTGHNKPSYIYKPY